MSRTPLNAFCALTMGQSPDSESYNIEHNGFPFYQGNADFGRIHPMVRVWCSAPKKLAKAGDILISVRAPIGALNIADCDCCIGRGLAAITPDATCADTMFLFYALYASAAELQRRGTGSTFKAISKNALSNLLLPSYCLEEQKEISAVLQQVDHLISLRQRQAEKLDELVKARFVEMFGDPVLNTRRLPSVSGTSLFKLSNGKAVPAEKRFDSGIPAYGGNGISWYTDEALINTDTLVVGRVGFQSGNVHFVYGPLWITDNAMYVTWYRKELICLRFLNQLMKRVDFSRYQDAGDLKKITQKPFMKFEYILPSMNLQMEFVNFMDSVNCEKERIQRSAALLETLKRSLMQQYFG